VDVDDGADGLDQVDDSVMARDEDLRSPVGRSSAGM
jgi:hypothetical protein